VAGLVNCGIGWWLGAKMPAVTPLLVAGLVGLFGYGVSLVLFILALRHIGTARTGAYFSTAPFLGAIVSVVFLAEPITGWILVAGLLMGIGVWLHLSERHEHVHAHEEVTHEHLHVHNEHHRHEHESETPIIEPHSHIHTHTKLTHSHPHYPDIHHRHEHQTKKS
jgi:multidrug transporter EmrE-like cation transporter